MSNKIKFGPWVGAVTSSTATVKVAVTLDVSAQLVVSRNSDLSDAAIWPM